MQEVTTASAPQEPTRISSVTSRPGRAETLFSAAALAAASFVVFMVCMDWRLNLYDEGVLLVGAARVLAGAVPHRDFYTGYGPGQFYILAGLFHLFGTTVAVERFWDAACRAAVVGLLFSFATPLMPRRAAWASAISATVWLSSVGSPGYAVFPAMAATLVSMTLAAACLERSGSRKALWAAGLWAGLACLFRYDIGLAAGAAVGGALAASSAWPRNGSGFRIRGAAASVAVFSSGAAAVLLPLAAVYTWLGVWPDLIFAVVTYPSRYYVKMRGLPFPGMARIAEAPSEIGVYIPVMACAAAAVTLIYTLVRSRNPVPWKMILLAGMTFVFLGKGLVRVSTIHMAMAISMSPVLVSSIAFTPGILRWWGGRLINRLAACAVVGCTAVAFLVVFFTASSNFDPPAPGWTDASGIARLGSYRIDKNRAAAIQDVAGRTAAGEPIFVGPGRYDKIYISDEAFYFLADRPPVTKWYQMDPGTQTTAEIQNSMVSEFRRTCLRTAVLDTYWDDFLDLNESSVSSGVHILDDYIKDNFTVAGRYGTISVLARKTQCITAGGNNAGSL